MTVARLLTNPPGKSSRQVGARYMIREALDAKFAELLKAKRDKFVSAAYKTKLGYLVWVKVPSGTRDMSFDVLLEFTRGADTERFADCTVRMYSNSPGWVFTQGYVVKKNGWLIPGWERALGRAATDAPKMTNPTETLSFDKIVHFALAWLWGVSGIKLIRDLEAMVAASTGANVPNPGDPRMTAAFKLEQYEKALRTRVAKKATPAPAATARKAPARKTGAGGRAATAGRMVKSVGSVKANAPSTRRATMAPRRGGIK